MTTHALLVVQDNRVCNQLSDYSGYLDIRKNLSVRIYHFSITRKNRLFGFVVFEITGLCISIRRYMYMYVGIHFYDDIRIRILHVHVRQFET